MKRWQSLGIAHKIWCGLGILILGNASLMVLGFISGRTVDLRLNALENSLFPAAMQSQQAHSAFNNQSTSYAVALGAAEPGLLDTAQRQAREVTQALETIVALIELPQDTRESVQQTLEQFTTFSQTAQTLYAAMGESSGDQDGLETVTALKQQVAELMQDSEEIQQSLDSLSRLFAETFTQEVAALRAKNKRNGMRNLSVAALAIIMTIVAVKVLISRGITGPVAALVRTARAIAKGDVRQVLHIKGHDEIGELAEVFKKLIVYLQEMANAATEISHGHLETRVHPRSKVDVLGIGFERMGAYLEDMGTVAKQVSQGDLRSRISLRSSDDQLGTAFIQMQAGLTALISDIRAGSDHIAEISAQVLTSSVTNAEVLKQMGETAEITSSSMSEVNSNAENVRMNMEHLTDSVETNSASINEMLSSMNQMAGNLRNLSHFADDTSATVVKIVDSLEQVTQQAEHSQKLSETVSRDAVSGQQSVEEMIRSVTAISDVTKHISETILRLEQRSLEIGTILDVIKDVADQTSLLSLNASIIAAQAGEHGRGFAVVAGEIKDLAARVDSSTQEIGTIITAVQHDSSDAAHTIEEGLHEVEHGVALAHQAGEALKKIASSSENSSQVAAEMALAVRQQTEAHLHITESIQNVTGMIAEISQTTQEQEKNSSQLFIMVEMMQNSASQVLKTLQKQQFSTRQVTESMVNVINLVEENTQTVQQVAQSANELTTQANSLKQNVKRFSIPARQPVEKSVAVSQT